MTAAMNETTSRLKAMENNHTNTTSTIKDISTCLNTQGASIDQQSLEIKDLGRAFETQNTLITALQTTQLQQGTTIESMSQIQSEIHRKLNILVTAAQASKPPAEDRMAAGNDHE